MRTESKLVQQLGKTTVVLTDDWELRGNGTGSVEDLQRKPALALMDLYDDLGIKSTFNVEVMQQLAFEQFAGADKSIRSGRDAWRETVKLMVARGFDVQLHLHPQWLGAQFLNGWWKLGRRWSIADYTSDEIAKMLDAAIAYLDDLTGQKKLTTFRGGSWGMGPPSRPIITELAKRGIRVDVSIVQGNYYDGEAIKLDYRNLDSPFFAYRPDIDDIRRMPRTPECEAPIIEIPTQSVKRGALISRMILNASKHGFAETIHGIASLARGSRAYSRAAKIIRCIQRPSADGAPSFVIRDPFGFQSGRARTDVVFDLSSDMPLSVYKEMIDICIERSKNDLNPTKLLVLENHTKDLQRPSDFTRIAGLVEHIQKKYSDIQFSTLAQATNQLAPPIC